VVSTLVELGRWQEALAHIAEADDLRASRHARGEAVAAAMIFCEQGRPDAAQAFLRDQAWQRDAEQPEHKVNFAHVEARVLRALDRPAEALAVAESGLAHLDALGVAAKGIKHCFAEVLEAALVLGDRAKATEVLATLDALRPGELTPSLEAQRARFHARLGDGDPDADYRTAAAIFAGGGLLFHHAVAQLEHAEWLLDQGRTEDAQPLLAQARSTFEDLEARPWLERVDASCAPRPSEVPA
jgi:tetratricopeptide (TPR) repeat protein